MTTSRFSALAFILLGALGSIVCALAIVITVFVGFRLHQTNTALFARVDEFMILANDRVRDAQQVLDQSKLTVESLTEGVNAIVKSEARQEVSNRLQLDEKTAQVSEAFQQADQWLEGALAASDDIQELLELGQTLGLSTDPGRIPPLETELTEMRGRLAEAIEQVSSVRRWVVPSIDEQAETIDAKPAVELMLKVVATMSDVDTRLGSAMEKLSGLQSRLDQLGSKLQRWITAATIIVCLLTGWMGLGQWFVCAHGLKRYRQG